MFKLVAGFTSIVLMFAMSTGQQVLHAAALQQQLHSLLFLKTAHQQNEKQRLLLLRAMCIRVCCYLGGVRGFALE
jgi:hypothetical protein